MILYQSRWHAIPLISNDKVNCLILNYFDTEFLLSSEFHHSPCLWRKRQPQACEQCPQWFCPPGSSPCQLCQGTYLKVIMYLSCQYILILPAIITIVQARGTSMPWDSGTSCRPFPVSSSSSLIHTCLIIVISFNKSY